MNEEQVIEDLLIGVVKVQDDHLIGISEFSTKVLKSGKLEIVLKGNELSLTEKKGVKRMHEKIEINKVLPFNEANAIWRKVHERKNQD